MAMRDCCGYDGMSAGDIDERYDLLGTLTPTIVAGRTGNGVRIQSLQHISKTGLPNHATYGVATAWKFDGSPLLVGPRAIIGLLDGQTEQVSLQFNQLGSVSVLRGATVLGTSANGVIIANTQHHIQFQATINNATGSFEARVDGVTVLTGTGQNTRTTANNQANGYQLGQGGNTSGPQIFDDVYCWDGSGSFNNTFPGDLKVLSSSPSGAGNSTQWTPSTGSNWAAVDDSTPNTGDYVASQTVGQKDTYAMSDIVGSGTPLGAQLSIYATKADAGAPRGIKGVCRNGGNESLSAEAIMSTAYRYWLSAVFELDPATGAAWANLAAINSAEFGEQVTT